MSLPAAAAAATAGARATLRSSYAATSAAASSTRPLLALARHHRPYGSLAAAAAPAAALRRRRPRRLYLQVRAARTESTGVSVGFRAPHFELPEPLTGKLWTLDDFEGNPALLVMFVCNHCPFVKHLKKDIAKLTSFYMENGLAAVAISSNSTVTHPQDGPEYMAEEAKLYKYSFPYLYDESQDVAKAFGAVCTPEFYLFKKDSSRPSDPLEDNFSTKLSSTSSGIPLGGLPTHPSTGSIELHEPHKFVHYECNLLLFYLTISPFWSQDGRRPFELFYHGQFDDSRPSNNVPVTGRDLSRAIDCALSGQELPFVPKPSVGCSIKWHP